jgi:hypothetical protein
MLEVDPKCVAVAEPCCGVSVRLFFFFKKIFVCPIWLPLFSIFHLM